MLSIAVVDDEKVFSDRLCRFIEQYGRETGAETAVTCFQDGMDITEDFKSKWDIIFLDIQMKHLDGLAAAKRIRACDSDVIIIFVTTMAQYAINGYGSMTMEFRTVYDALVIGQAVCEGFAVGFNYLLSLAGIKSKEVVSNVMQHCWNCVRINENWYHVDVTFDNPIVRGRAGAITHMLTHDYFLLSDTALIAKGKHHDWDRQHLPPATDTRFDRVKWVR